MSNGQKTSGISQLIAFRQLNDQLADLSKQVSNVSPEVQAQEEFFTQTVEGAAKVGLTPSDLARLLDPSAYKDAKGAAKTEKAPRKAHKPRALKIYENPTTGERIETKGGNHKTLKVWKTEHGNDVVETWRKDVA